MTKLCLIIIDGFGVAEPGPGNARVLANTPTLDRLAAELPNCLMQASGNAVGLPEGQQGASEPGHVTIGAGRVVWQPLEEINQAIKHGQFEQNEVLVNACIRARDKGTPLHLLGMYSSGGVHSAIEHWQAMLKLAKAQGVQTVYLHLFSDGRDVAEQYFCTEFTDLQEFIDEQKLGVVASVIGRYFAMDRDKQYADRTQVAYKALTKQGEELTEDVCADVKQWYIDAPEGEATDYYIRPLQTKAFAAIKPEDTVVCINFRSDRMIQIVRALEAEDFTEFPRPVRVSDVVCMGPYSDHLPIAFPPQDVQHNLGQTVAKAGLKQLRIAETDKFAHVTFFFNSQHHEPYTGEDRILVDSPKVSNYAQTPKMSAAGITANAKEQIASGKYDLIVMNYANPDLVGHGGDIEAAKIACETVDQNISELLEALDTAGYDYIITSDHGNAECMLYEDGKTIRPTHTTSPVQTFVRSVHINQADLDALGQDAGLKDIAPMCLKILGLEVPEEMKGS